MMRTRTLAQQLLLVSACVCAVGGESRAAQVANVETPVSTLIEGTHARLLFESDVTRVAVGRSQTMAVEILNSRELLLLGQEQGRTSLFVWFKDGRTETRLFSIEPDLSFLRKALADIHPSITVGLAPHQGAVVLRGVVPDVSYRAAAEAAAGAYLDSRANKTAPTALGDQESADGEEADESSVRPQGDPTNDAAVINLIQLERLPVRIDGKIRQVLEPMEGANVSVRRVQLGDMPNDSADLFVLEGSVRDQVTLTRVLFLASRALLGNVPAGRIDIKVLADEAGALTNVEDLFGAAMVGGGNQQNISLGGNQNQVGGRNNQQLVNRIGANLGRAKVIEAAGGRILAMITVENLPLVRVDVRLYEVNLTRLRQWRNDLGVITSDFDQGDLLPGGLAEALQGGGAAGGAASVGQDDVQNLLGFLGGELNNQSQIVSGGLAVENVFRLLVNQQLARALSRPSLTVLSGELALFQVGGQVPIPVAVTVGGGTDQVLNGVEFRDFGVQLSIRPLVEEVDAETITLDLSPIVSLPDLDLTAAIGAVTDSAPNTTAFETRGARTHTRLKDGESMLIGGLISQRQESAQSKTPGLGDLPLAGWMFRNEAEDAEDFELVIVVNPVIVRPERPDARLWAFMDPGDALAGCFDEVHSRRSEDEAADECEPKDQDHGEQNLNSIENSSEPVAGVGH